MTVDIENDQANFKKSSPKEEEDYLKQTSSIQVLNPEELFGFQQTEKLTRAEVVEVDKRISLPDSI